MYSRQFPSNPQDLLTHTGDQEIQSVCERFSLYLGDSVFIWEAQSGRVGIHGSELNIVLVYG